METKTEIQEIIVQIENGNMNVATVSREVTYEPLDQMGPNGETSKAVAWGPEIYKTYMFDAAGMATIGQFMVELGIVPQGEFEHVVAVNVLPFEKIIGGQKVYPNNFASPVVGGRIEQWFGVSYAIESPQTKGRHRTSVELSADQVSVIGAFVDEHFK